MDRKQNQDIQLIKREKIINVMYNRTTRRYILTFITIISLLLLLINAYRYNIYKNNALRKDFQDSVKFQNTKTHYLFNCFLILNNNLNEIIKARNLVKQLHVKTIPDENYIFDKQYCPSFRQIRGYGNYPIKDSEYEFPLAFSILVYYNVEQFERLLKLIYRPHNLYCIHIDAKSSKEIHKAIESIVQCFDNVFIASKLENIIYAGISRLKADINCMNDLYNSNFTFKMTKKLPKWKYFINLASTEFPLRTNYELTRILRLYNGANDIEVLHNIPIDRIKYSWRPKYENNEYSLVKTTISKSPTPHNFKIAKGIAFGMFNYEFVGFVLNNKYAKDLLEWAEDTFSPDEWYAHLDPLVL
jgi:hypothetical protein